MATVTGNAADITGATMNFKQLRIIFTLNQVNIGTNTGTLIPDNHVEVTPESDGSFSVGLQPTTMMALEAWYTVTLVWLQQQELTHSQPVALRGDLAMKIRVPNAGGRIDDLIIPGTGGGNPNRRVVWVSQTPPLNPYPFMLWLEQEYGPAPDPFDPKNTSILHEWRP